MKNLNSTISESSLITATKEQVSSDLAGEVVILNLKTGTYYGLNPVGARIWSLIQEPKTVDEIRQMLLNEYEIDSDTCDQDIRELLDDLANSDLIEIKNEPTV
jgi:Coenzyme PQQ synthesis protein D (PqqD)